MEFIYADELKKKFKAFGHFYNLVLDQETFPCRSMLEIISIDEDYPTQRLVDALVIMMNPGSSRPLDKNYNPQNYIINDMYLERWTKEIIPAYPDSTQYQIMRLMVNQNWRYVRIINLSDLQNGDIGDFFQNFSRSNLIDDSNPHSIFHTKRKIELAKYLIKKKDGLIILAWGSKKFLFQIAKKAICALDNYPFVGLSNDISNLCFKHPNPRLTTQKLLWLNEIVFEIEKHNKSKE